MTWKFTDERKNVLTDGTSFVPVDKENRDYADLLNSGLVPTEYIAKDPTDIDARDEYRRRLFAILGADDLAHAGFIRADDSAEAWSIRQIAVEARTPEQVSRLAELELRDAAVQDLINRWNEMPTPPPADYTDDRYWR